MTVVAEAVLARVNPGKIHQHEAGVVSIVETEPGGQGELRIDCPTAAIVYSGFNKPPIAWLSNLKCADGAIVRRESQSTVAYIVELKSTLTLKEFLKVRAQMRGGYLNVLALNGVLSVGPPDSVVFVVAFKVERLTEAIRANPSLGKFVAEVEDQPLAEWNSSIISFPELGRCPLIKVTQDRATGIGNLAFS